MKISNDHLKVAYRKLKSLVYHDKTDLRLRYRLAEFEYDPGFDQRLREVARVANSADPVNEKSFQLWLKAINFRIVPKSLAKPDVRTAEGKFISNVTSAKSLVVAKVNYFFDGPIELHLIAVLWIMFEGRFLDAQLGNECYGARLVESLSHPEDRSAGLFRKYHELYAGWRDQGLKKAKQLLIEDKTNVFILGLDVQEYFYRIKLDFPVIAQSVYETQRENDDSPDVAQTSNLLGCLEAICSGYRLKIEPFLMLTHENVPLDTGIPIGLCTSPLLANWYLRAFDKAVKTQVRPAYYGRYIDDILIVLAAHEDPSNEIDPVAAVMNSVLVQNKVLRDASVNLYELKNPHGLFLQQEKCILQYFDAAHSIAGLEKFQKKLELNGSDFLLMPVDEADSSLEDVAYELLYEGSVNKFRSVKGMAENRYELAKHLAKQTILHLLTDDPPDPKVSLGLRQFFKGKSAIEFSDLWERVLTFFLIANDKRAAIAFVKNLQSEIKRVQFQNNSSVTEHLITGLEHHLLLCQIMSGALVETELESDSNTQIPTNEALFRQANLIRHHFVRIPLLNYTNYLGSLTTRVVDSLVEVDLRKLELSPRYVNFDECLLLANSGDIKLGKKTAFQWAQEIFQIINGREVVTGMEWRSVLVDGERSND